jgi:hypothetical protein
MLKAPRTAQRLKAIEFLADAPIDEGRREEVVDALEVAEQNARLRLAAQKAVEHWESSADVAWFTKRLESAERQKYVRAMENLSKKKDDGAAKALAGQLAVQGRAAEAARHLPAMGKLCEAHVLRYYNDERAATRDGARKVLDKIETPNDARVSQCLSDLGAAGLGRRKSAAETLQALKRTGDEKLNGKVGDKLVALVKDKDLAGDALAAMRTWITKDNVPALLDLARSNKGREEGIHQLLIEQFPEHVDVVALLMERLDRRASRDSARKALVEVVPVLAERLGDKDQAVRNQAYEALVKLGKAFPVEKTAVEAAILKRYSADQDPPPLFKCDAAARLVVYDVLVQVGTKKSVPLLKQAVAYEKGKNKERATTARQFAEK